MPSFSIIFPTITSGNHETISPWISSKFLHELPNFIDVFFSNHPEIFLGTYSGIYTAFFSGIFFRNYINKFWSSLSIFRKFPYIQQLRPTFVGNGKGSEKNVTVRMKESVEFPEKLQNKLPGKLLKWKIPEEFFKKFQVERMNKLHEKFINHFLRISIRHFFFFFENSSILLFRYFFRHFLETISNVCSSFSAIFCESSSVHF